MILAGPPTAAELFDACDTNGNDIISKDEAIACIEANVPEEFKESFKAEVKANWSTIDPEADGVTRAELEVILPSEGQGKG
jgi:hypothetical protein